MANSAALYRVLCDGGSVGEFDRHEDAESMAAGWNRAYPPPEYPPFVVVPECHDADCGRCGSA